MKNKDIIVPLREFDYDELSDMQRRLVDEARAATRRAYSPYSRFSVGAAILLDNGEIVCGANQENAATPSSLCAERTAAYYAHSRYPDAHFRAVAIAARGTDALEVELPISPCGACRQALLEYETLAGADVEILLAGRGSIYRLPSVKSLLPLAFTEF